MPKIAKTYFTKNEMKHVTDFDSTFDLQPLERGFALTIGTALRRTLLSSVSSLAPFAVRIRNVEQEFSYLPNVTDDILNLLLNLKDIKFRAVTPVRDDEIFKVHFKSSEPGVITAKDLITPPEIEISNPDAKITTIATADALELEIFIISGRGYVSFEENKKFLNEIKTRLASDIKYGEFLAIDSDFSPVSRVNIKCSELNSSSNIIQEKLEIEIVTNGTVTAEDALKQSSKILIAHLQKIANLEEVNEEDVFEKVKSKEEFAPKNNDPIESLELSIRSLNALRRAKIKKVSDLQQLTKEELENVKNLGKKSVDEIITKLSEKGIELNKGEE